MLQLPNVDRDPIPRWSFGRVTLVGDAAHPMQPIGAQAGSQAVVDARVLAAVAPGNADPVEALVRYQDQRIAAMNDMILRNRNFGPETVLQIAEERAPDGFASIGDVLTQDELEQYRAELQAGRRASISRPSTAASPMSSCRARCEPEARRDWRPGLELNQGGEPCTASASPLRHRANPVNMTETVDGTLGSSSEPVPFAIC